MQESHIIDHACCDFCGNFETKNLIGGTCRQCFYAYNMNKIFNRTFEEILNENQERIIKSDS